MSDDEICGHLHPGPWPLRTELVLDDHLGPTDAVVACRQCGRPYLLEMLDWKGPLRVFRVAVLDADESARLLRDLSRGSCDVARAASEVEHFRSRTRFSPWLLLQDTRTNALIARAPVPDGSRLPGAAWRELPCDGHWVDYTRSYTDIVNG